MRLPNKRSISKRDKPALKFSIAYCALRPAPHFPKYRQAVACPRAAQKIGDVPKSPFPSVAALLPSAGTITPNQSCGPRGCLEYPPAFVPPRAAFGARPPYRKAKAMQVPSILQGESLTRLLQGAAVGAIATMFIGFYWGGWSLASTADKMAKERSELAVIAALAPVCADKFRALPDAEAKKVALSKVETWKRRDEFPKELITLPGESYPSSALVDACYTLLFPPKSAALK